MRSDDDTDNNKYNQRSSDKLRSKKVWFSITKIIQFKSLHLLPFQSLLFTKTSKLTSTSAIAASINQTDCNQLAIDFKSNQKGIHTKHSTFLKRRMDNHANDAG